MLECNVKPSSALVHIANLLSDMVVPNIFISNIQEFLFFSILGNVVLSYLCLYLSDEYKVFPSFHMFFGHSSLQLMFIFFTHFFHWVTVFFYEFSGFFIYSRYWCFVCSVQLLSHVQLFATLWNATRQASLFITNSRSPPKPISIELVMPSNLCCPLLLLPSIFPSIRVFSNESVIRKVLEFQLQHQSFQWIFRHDFL